MFSFQYALHRLLVIFFVLALTACAGVSTQSSTSSKPTSTKQDQFFTNLRALCGKSFAGALASRDPADQARFAGGLTMQVRDCSDTSITIPFGDASGQTRQWIISRTPTGLTLKHLHLSKDGRPERISGYGGTTGDTGTAQRQTFFIDEFSRRLFSQNQLESSLDNSWAIEIKPNRVLAYELIRPDKRLRLEFDLRQAK